MNWRSSPPPSKNAGFGRVLRSQPIDVNRTVCCPWSHPSWRGQEDNSYCSRHPGRRRGRCFHRLGHCRWSHPMFRHPIQRLSHRFQRSCWCFHRLRKSRRCQGSKRSRRYPSRRLIRPFPRSCLTYRRRPKIRRFPVSMQSRTGNRWCSDRSRRQPSFRLFRRCCLRSPRRRWCRRCQSLCSIARTRPAWCPREGLPRGPS
ncbi:hypothetical protein ACVIVC_002690 [Sinorhizobium meliloti]|nr:hypothetical protein SinmeB_4054 [Sinorhizobium meliloti BL225C]SDZ49856.1 hypothetical protein SAMN04244576_06198 [Sinorhizobium meliloti]